jgi:hypothetical protein
MFGPSTNITVVGVGSAMRRGLLESLQAGQQAWKQGRSEQGRPRARGQRSSRAYALT